MLYNLINWYTRRFPFPFRGLKYFLRLLKMTGNDQRQFLKKLPKGPFIRVSPAEHIQLQLFWYGYYEKKYVQTWQSFVQEDQVILDVGANIGYYSLVAAFKAPGSRVFAFEPSSVSYLHLQENKELNGLRNLHTRNFALGRVKEERLLYVSNAANTGLTGFSPPEAAAIGTETILIHAADEWVKEEGIEKIDLVKMDIEGFEYHALQGMKQVLENFHPVLFLEISEPLLQKFGNSRQEVFDFLHQFGYRAFAIAGKNLLRPLSLPLDDELVVFLYQTANLPSSIRISV